MRSEPILNAVPQSPVLGLPELYAIAHNLAEKAAARYGAFANRTDEAFWPLRCVFEVLATREIDRSHELSALCQTTCGLYPDAHSLRWAPIDLVPSEEMAEVGNSSLSTPYTAWALAVRHRQRAFVFWTYVIALAEDPAVRLAAESLAREALSDGNLLRRERRLAWQTERQTGTEGAMIAGEEVKAPSTALLESLLLRDMAAWSRGLDQSQREYLVAFRPSSMPSHFLDLGGEGAATTAPGDIADIVRRALRRAEQLSNIYLEDADRATDQSSMELAQELASQSVARLAELRQLASEVTPR